MALKPITRQEQIIAGKDLEPITRMEKFLKEYGGGGGASSGGGATSYYIKKDDDCLYHDVECTHKVTKDEFMSNPNLTNIIVCEGVKQYTPNMINTSHEHVEVYINRVNTMDWITELYIYSTAEYGGIM